MALDVVNTLLSGFILLFIGLIAYQTGYRWFKPSGDYQFTSKDGAQVTLVIFVFITGLIGDPIYTLVKEGTLGMTVIKQLGIIIMLSRIAANATVPNWTHGDEFTLIQYFVGVGLLASPWLF